MSLGAAEVNEDHEVPPREKDGQPANSPVTDLGRVSLAVWVTRVRLCETIGNQSSKNLKL